jgi:hypothetical protein
MLESGRIWMRLAAAAVVAMLAGCASGPTVRATTDPAADFGKYHTYGFVEHLGTDRGEYSTLVSRALKAAVATEMEKRGYRAAENPDLLVNFQANTQHSQELSTMPSVGVYRGGYAYPLDGSFYGYGCLQSARDVVEGTLNVDLVDRARHQSVWEGVALGKLTEKQMRQPDSALPPLVGSIFLKYPYAAGRGTADVQRP